MQPDIAQIWDWLDQVPDPEIPVISVVDLGIVRGVEWNGDTLEVAVTPTYSGCPATSIISLDIETAMIDRGVAKTRIKTQLSPPWTTDWLSDKGKAKLEDYGIAPPPPRWRPRALPALQIAKRQPHLSIRLNPLQGTMALHGLP